MQLLISDANILIDLEVGGLLAPMFSLPYEFAVPDVLYYEELEERHSDLIGMGLVVKELDASLVARVSEFALRYRKPGRNDLFALVLASHEECPLLTGDRDLRAAAESENIEVRGTIWLVGEMVRAGMITKPVVRGAYFRMQAQGRRLLWDLAEAGLRALE